MKIYKIGPVLLSPTTLKYNIFRENKLTMRVQNTFLNIAAPLIL